MPSTSLENLELVALEAVDQELFFIEVISIFFDA